MSDPPDRPVDRPRRTAQFQAARHPSGSWQPGEFDDGPTPPPVNAEDAASAWARQRTRVTAVEHNMVRVEGAITGMSGSIGDLTRRVAGLEETRDKSQESLVTIERVQALQGQSLLVIERGVNKLESARDTDGAKFRHIIQILAAVAAIAVSIVALATR